MLLPSEPADPRYVEAYPRLNLRDALKYARKDRPVVLWRDRQKPIGHGRVAFDRADLNIECRFRRLPYLPDEDVSDFIPCALTDKKTGTDVITYCVSCRRKVRILIFADDKWACQHCQKLVYRRSLLGKSNIAYLRLQELEAMIGKGRAKNMTAKKFTWLNEELKALRIEVGDYEYIPRSDLRYDVTARWYPEGPAVVASLADPTGLG